MKEIERRWLLKQDPVKIDHEKFLDTTAFVYYESVMNVYLPDGKRLRLRGPYMQDTFPPIIEVTEKTGEGLVREEVTYTGISRTLFDLKKENPLPFVYKMRVYLPHDYDCKELILDYFKAPDPDLTVVEAEFLSEKQAADFKFPGYFEGLDMEEITGKAEYSNYELAKKTLEIMKEKKAKHKSEALNDFAMDKLLHALGSKKHKKEANS